MRKCLIFLGGQVNHRKYLIFSSNPVNSLGKVLFLSAVQSYPQKNYFFQLSYHQKKQCSQNHAKPISLGHTEPAYLGHTEPDQCLIGMILLFFWAQISNHPKLIQTIPKQGRTGLKSHSISSNLIWIQFRSKPDVLQQCGRCVFM